MSDLADFVLNFCRILGGVVDPPTYGVHEVLLPDPVAAQLGIGPLQRFGFDESAEGEAVIRLAYGHPLVERMAELARAAPACAQFYLNDVRLDKTGLVALARAALSFPNASLGEAPRALETRLMFHYVRFNFKAALISDEKREHLASVLMNAQTGAVVEDFSASEAYRLAETPAFTGLPTAPAQWIEAADPLAAEPLRALLDRAGRAAADALHDPITAMQSHAARRLELDRARLEAYYADLERDLERRLQRADDDARRANLERKLAAVRAEHAAKLADAESKHQLRVELDLVNLAVIAQPKLALDVRLENRQASVTRTVIYDPLRHSIEPLRCDVCARPTARLFLCANGHLAGADCLAPQCVDCKRVYCQTCASEITACVVCDRPVCRKSLSVCRECGRGVCREHLHLCHAADGQPQKTAAIAGAGDAGPSPSAPASNAGSPPPAPRPPVAPAPTSRPKLAPPKGPAPQSKTRTAPPSSDPGYRLEVQIEKDAPLVVAFVLAKGGREIAQRHWELTGSGIVVYCYCEKGWQCPVAETVLKPESPAQIEAQLEGEIARLRAEYRIPAHRAAIHAEQYGRLIRLPRLRLLGQWKDEAFLAAARAASGEPKGRETGPEPEIDYPDWALAFTPDESARFLPDIDRFVRIAYGWLWYEGALKANELAELTASVARPAEWYSPERARDVFKADSSFRNARGNAVFIDLADHPLKVLEEKEARRLPPRTFTADELLAAAAGPLPLTRREAEIESELNRNITRKVYVRSMQRIIRNTFDPAQWVSHIVSLCAPRDLEEANHFAQLVTELWNNTPRYELRGRTPSEVASLRSADKG